VEKVNCLSCAADQGAQKVIFCRTPMTKVMGLTRLTSYCQYRWIKSLDLRHFYW
jgi:hypothetical protein